MTALKKHDSEKRKKKRRANYMERGYNGEKQRYVPISDGLESRDN